VRSFSDAVALVSTRDGRVVVLHEWNGAVGGTKFSPDGRHVAFHLGDRGQARATRAFVVPAGGGSPIAVVNYGSRDRVAGWSLDGRPFLFSSDRRGSVDLWTVDMAGGRCRNA
jgi:Tol biopolymer transport system component